jgi:hypothetical protein
MEMSLEKMVENLLREVNAISEKYDEIAKITGENYNIFEILGVSSKELSHSKILTDLLNPKGSHCCGEVFLKLFFEKFLPDKKDVDFSNCQISKECLIGDGRLDICIDYSDFRLGIENKIYAPEGEGQFKKYRDFLEQKYQGDYCLIYLTLKGEKPNSCGYECQKYPESCKCKCLSYRKDILEWLELCQKEVFNKPLIRETLEQYKNLLKILTHQTRSKEMSKEIIRKITETAGNYKSAVEIGSNLREARKKILCDYLINPLKKLAEEKYDGLKCVNDDPDPDQIGNLWFGFKKEGWDIFIRFLFFETDNGKLYCGLGKWYNKLGVDMPDWVEKLKKNGKENAKDTHYDVWGEKFNVYGASYHENICKLIEESKLSIDDNNREILRTCERKIMEIMELLQKIKTA